MIERDMKNARMTLNDESAEYEGIKSHSLKKWQI